MLAGLSTFGVIRFGVPCKCISIFFRVRSFLESSAATQRELCLVFSALRGKIPSLPFKCRGHTTVAESVFASMCLEDNNEMGGLSVDYAVMAELFTKSNKGVILGDRWGPGHPKRLIGEGNAISCLWLPSAMTVVWQ